MRRTEKILLYFCGAVMDFTWLYAWAIFSMISIGKNGFPLADTAAIFIAAAAAFVPAAPFFRRARRPVVS